MAGVGAGSSKKFFAAILLGLILAIVLNRVVASTRQKPEDAAVDGGTRHLQQLLRGRSLLQGSSSSQGALLIDYMGANGDTSLQFSDLQATVSAFPAVQFIFPLAFAIDADASGNPQNGIFSPYWVTSLDSQSAQLFKQQNPNVKLMVSLAGATQYINDSNPSQPVNWYDPASIDEWVRNAVSSITSLASTYSLDGIDIDYETYPSGSASFTSCIGQVISTLKSSNTITVASIAPFDDTLSIYADLFANYASVIDYVNYQFYGDGLTTQSEYVNRFNTVAASFSSSSNKVLASVEVGGRGLQGNDFIGAATQLRNSIAGIMNWDVDHSKNSNPPFALEQSVATFLTSA